MRPAGLKRYRSWLPAVAVAVLVLLGGARLIVLSTRDHAAQLRSAAQAAVSQQTRAIEAELGSLLERARGEARRASAVPDRQAFSVGGAGRVLRTGDADPTVSLALASEWAAAHAARSADPAGLFGPVRYGSQWFVAAQAPLAGEGTTAGPATAGGRAFAYVALDGLLLRSGFKQLARAGYDFELYQDVAHSGAPRVLLSSRADGLEAPVTGEIPAPGSAAAPSAYLALAVRPRTGWYPAGSLIADVVVLALAAWMLGFGAHDLSDSVARARAALATARGRLRAANARLAAEIEQHEGLQKNLEHARYHDPNTGLPNRRYFMSQVDRALRDLRGRRRRRLAIILIEIDRFALINDTLGHTAGDELLLQVAQRFANVLEGTEHILARWAGDQCAALLYEVDPDEVRRITGALQLAREQPFALRKHRVRVATRMGFTCIGRGLERPEEALREAGVALSIAKREAGTPVVQYTANMGDAAVSLVNLEADLHVALERGEFGLLFQPIFDLRAPRAVGVEALLRWYHPVEGMLTPARFLPIAEEAAVIVPVTRWVIDRVCRLIAQWRQSLPPDADFFVSVNLSPAALGDAGLWQHVASVLEATRIPPGYLKFEVSERGLVENVSAVRTLLVAFHKMGIQLMLDDFGSGYSSLSFLQLLPFDYVKIDRPFANRTGSEHANNAITAAIMQLASSLGLRTVAEVVESEAAARALAALGCDFGQGQYFSAPLEAAAALELLREAPILTTIVSTAAAAAAEAVTARAPDETPILEETPTLVLPDTPTLVLEAVTEGGQARAPDETLILEDTPTLVLPDTPTLVLEAVTEGGQACEDEAGTGTPRTGS